MISGGEFLELLQIAGASFAQAAVSALLSLVMGWVLGMWLSEWGPDHGGRRARQWLAITLALPSAFSAIVVVSAWGRWLEFGWSAVLFAHVFWNIPWVAWHVLRARETLDPAQQEAAWVSGAERTARARWIVAPGVRGAAARAAVQSFLFCLGSFAVVLTLGGGPPVETLETVIYSSLRAGVVAPERAAIAAGLQWALGILAAALLWRGPRVHAWVATSGTRAVSDQVWLRPRGAGRIARVVGATVWMAPAALLFAQIRSVPDASSVGELVEATLHSVALGAAVSVLAVSFALALALSRRGGLEFLAQWPASASALVLSVLLFVVGFAPYRRPLLFLIAVQALIVLPLVGRGIFAAVRAQPVREREVARVLGAPWWERLAWVDFPRLTAPLAAALALGAGVSLSEVGAATLFASEDWVTLPALWGRWVGRYDWDGAAWVSAVVLVAAGGLLWMGLRSGAREQGDV